MPKSNIHANTNTRIPESVKHTTPAQRLFRFLLFGRSEDNEVILHNLRALLWASGGSERPENDPVDHFQRRTGRQAPGLGAEPADKQCAKCRHFALLAILSQVKYNPYNTEFTDSPAACETEGPYKKSKIVCQIEPSPMTSLYANICTVWEVILI